MLISLLWLAALLPPSLAWLPDDKILGVNLGSLFIIEKWMAYTEFKEMGCVSKSDEWSCVEYLGQDTANSVFATHWDTWITEDDIKEIQGYGLNTVRVPVGFWIYEDIVESDEYYPQGALTYLDRLMGWCKQYDLYVILDLHAGCGTQAVEKQFTGHLMSDPGFYTDSNYDRAYQFLEWITERIHTTDSYSTVGMIEVLNEPVSGSTYSTETTSMVENYYPTALEKVRAVESNLSVSSASQLHVQFMNEAWSSIDPTQNISDTNNTVLDNHRYLAYKTSVTQTQDGYLEAACECETTAEEVVGEWSLAVSTTVENTTDFRVANASSEVIDFYQKYWAVQAYKAYTDGLGWVFWSWKSNKINKVDDWRWNYQSAVSAGVIPTAASDAAATATSVCASVSSRKQRRSSQQESEPEPEQQQQQQPSRVYRTDGHGGDPVAYVVQHRTW